MTDIALSVPLICMTVIDQVQKGDFELTCHTIHSHPQAAMVSTVASLATRSDREQWENLFNQNYIQPVLQVYIYINLLEYYSETYL